MTVTVKRMTAETENVYMDVAHTHIVEWCYCVKFRNKKEVVIPLRNIDFITEELDEEDQKE
jgi:hypothetical protein